MNRPVFAYYLIGDSRHKVHERDARAGSHVVCPCTIRHPAAR